MSKYITFESACDIVKNLKLMNTNEWRNWIKNNKEYNIPYNPDTYYKDYGWVNWKHFLNKNFKLDFISHSEAKEILKELNIKNNKEFKKWIKDNKSFKIPMAPENTYKNSGWISWGDFLSNKNVHKKLFMEYNKAIEVLKKFNLKSQNEYLELLKKNIVELPTNPNVYYKEWKSWSEYLSNEIINNFNKTFISYEDSKIIISELKLKNVKEFFKKRPSNIPVDPKSYYKEKWISWGEYLGTNNKSNRIKKEIFLNYEQAKLYLKDLNIKHKYDYIEYINENNIDFLPKRPDYIYRDKWSGFLEYLNCESLRSSYGERKINDFLENRDIKFIKEMKFESCKNKKLLPFDFYLPDYKMCIEYDGQHHFNIVSKFGGIELLDKVKENDNIKNEWCILNNIKLIRIPYTKKNKIFEILNKEFV